MEMTVLGLHEAASNALVICRASMKSRVITEYATGVSRRSLASRARVSAASCKAGVKKLKRLRPAPLAA